MNTIRTGSGWELPAEIVEALEMIVAGSTADALESPTLEFKEDPARNPHSRGNPDAQLIDVLLDETVCLANGDAGDAHIIVGVADKTAGVEGLVGTDRDPMWLSERIFNGTRPNLRVEADFFEFHAVKLIWIRIPRAFTIYERTKGQATRRVGSQCEPLSAEARRVITAQRANPDLSAQPSGLFEDQLDTVAFSEAKKLLTAKRLASGDATPLSLTNMGVLRELGLLTRGGDITVAAEILFAPLAPGKVSVRHLHRAVPGGEPQSTEITSPLILAFGEAQNLIQRSAAQEIARVPLGSGQEVPIQAFPQPAVDEVVSNALVHRDWNMNSPIVIDQSPRVLSVRSPGPLPYGVTEERLLTTQSIPRNPTLMSAMRILGLVEESSRGFDRMWASMLMTGREVPQVTLDDISVEVTLSAGRPNVGFIVAVHALIEKYGYEIITAVSTLIVLWHLYFHPLITLREVMKRSQTTELEARALMGFLQDEDIVQQVRDSAQEWVLTDGARKDMGLQGKRALASVSIQDWIEAQLESGAALTNRDIAQAMGVEGSEVTGILRHLRMMGRAMIDPTGPQRGANTRWIAR